MWVVDVLLFHPSAQTECARKGAEGVARSGFPRAPTQNGASGGVFATLACLLPRLDARRCRQAAVLESVRFVGRFHDMTMISEPIQKRRDHVGVTQHAEPFKKAQVDCNYDTAMLVPLRQQMKQ